MFDFFSGCASLFSKTFYAIVGEDFFLWILGALLFLVMFNFFCFMSRETRKM